MQCLFLISPWAKDLQRFYSISLPMVFVWRYLLNAKLFYCTYLLIYLHTYLLTPGGTAFLEKLTGFQLVKKFPVCYETRRFITTFTRARHLSLSWPIPPHPTSWRSTLILSSHLILGLPGGLFPSRFPTKTLYTPLLSPIRATCSAHLILLYFITRTILGEEYISLSSSLI